MPRFNAETAVIAAEVTQIIVDWGHDLDINDCKGVPDLCTPDCDYLVGGNNNKGREAIAAFYAARNERVRTQQKDGIRTQRHALSNVRVEVTGPDTANATFTTINYSAEGPAPILTLVGPTIVADSRMEFRRGTDGEWLISLFDSTPIFVGSDPFLNASVAKK